MLRRIWLIKRGEGVIRIIEASPIPEIVSTIETFSMKNVVSTRLRFTY